MRSRTTRCFRDDFSIPDELESEAAAINWIRDACAHLKVIGFTSEAASLFERASLATDADQDLVDVSGGNFDRFHETASQYRVWDRQPSVRSF